MSKDESLRNDEIRMTKHECACVVWISIHTQQTFGSHRYSSFPRSAWERLCRRSASFLSRKQSCANVAARKRQAIPLLPKIATSNTRLRPCKAAEKATPAIVQHVPRAAFQPDTDWKSSSTILPHYRSGAARALQYLEQPCIPPSNNTPTATARHNTRIQSSATSGLPSAL